MPPSGRIIFQRRKFSTYVSAFKSKPTLLSFLHCALSLAAQCIVIGPVCLQRTGGRAGGRAGVVCLFVGLLTR